MKKFIIIALCLTILLSSVTYAAGYQQNILASFNTVILNVNGKTVNSGNILYNGTTYVPIRAAAEALNCKVNWNNDTKTADIIGYGTNNVNTSYLADIIDIKSCCDGVVDGIELLSDKSQYLGENNMGSIDSMIKTYTGIDEYIKWISEKINIEKVKYVGGTEEQYNQLISALSIVLSKSEKIISDTNRYLNYKDINLYNILNDYLSVRSAFFEIVRNTAGKWYYSALNMLRYN